MNEKMSNCIKKLFNNFAQLLIIIIKIFWNYLNTSDNLSSSKKWSLPKSNVYLKNIMKSVVFDTFMKFKQGYYNSLDLRLSKMLPLLIWMKINFQICGRKDIW